MKPYDRRKHRDTKGQVRRLSKQIAERMFLWPKKACPQCGKEWMTPTEDWDRCVWCQEDEQKNKGT